MKKIFLTALAVCLLSVANVACALPDYNIVRVSDLSPQEFFDRMINGEICQTLRQEGTNISVTAPERHPELDDPQNAPGLEVYSSVSGLQGATPNNEIHFFVDSEGCVGAVRVLNTGGDLQQSGMIIGMILDAIGLNLQEIQTLANDPAEVSEIWCQNAGRKIICITNHQGIMMFFGASD